MRKTFLVTFAAGASLALLGAAAAQGPGRGGDRFWDRFDKDGDGRVPVEDLVGRAAERADEIDADGDGFITREEMDAYREARREDMQAMRFPDRNGDGVVDRAEYEAAARERFDKLDANGDGVLTEDEVPGPRGRRGPKK